MQIALRPARSEDFDYCRRLYFAGMAKIIEELALDRAAQNTGFQEQWVMNEVQIITLDGSDAGWLQTKIQGNKLFLAQIFVDSPFQCRGIGTEVMNRLICEAARAGQAMVLGVVKINPAVRLYKRLGFQITHEDDRKLYMRRDP